MTSRPRPTDTQPRWARRLSWRRATVVQAGERRSASIESLRALAALSVLVFHIFYVDAEHAAHPQSLAYQAGLSGRYGVFLFFSISGYLLFRPFVDAHLGRGDGVSLRRYARNRALRILPLYYVILLILFLGSNGAIPGSEALRYALFLENYSAHTIYRVDTPMWSLVVEVQFYVLLPLIAMALGRWGTRRPKRWLLALGVIAAASYAARWILVYEQPYSPTQLEWTASLLTNLVFFVPGMVLAVLVSQREFATRWCSRAGWRSAGAWAGLAAGLWVLTIIGWPTQRAFEADILIGSFLILGTCVLPLSPSPALRFLSWRPLALIGVISYSLYLWHENFVLLLAPELRSPWLGIAVLLPLCLAWAAGSYFLIERPFLRQRRPAHGEPSAAADSEAPAPAAVGLPAGVGLPGPVAPGLPGAVAQAIAAPHTSRSQYRISS